MTDVEIPPELTRVLVVTAHPDDVDFGSAGTVATLVAAGVSVTYCIVTDGDAGGFDPTVPRSEIPGIRRSEQVAAAAVVGVTDVRFLGYRDGELTVSHELRRDITRVIRQVQPQRVMTMSPVRNWERIAASHPDHMAAGEATVQAIYPDARNQFAHPMLMTDEGLEEWVVTELWMSGSPTPNTFVDVTEHLATKLAALRAHASQTEHVEDLEGMIRGWMTETAKRGGLPEGRLAEMFHAVTLS
ncbi:MAG TPA: PIG-L deacetylase family protein [Motilibacterales bacterium]|nr:PIG-L deacetylase family protein [Motilibacterales bacterium]